MVNGNYVLYGDRSSESEIIDDHVQTRTAERKNKRKCNRTANDLQRTLNLAQLDNETDSVKYEKKIKEPRLLRYVATTDVEENFVTEKFETYDLKATEERPRRYAFQKKPKNPADGSVNYAYSRSSSSCSSPNGNLPTISEHAEQQYGTYRVKAVPSPKIGEIINGYETKLDKYFAKPKDLKKFGANVTYKGSHPDSLYRVPTESGVGGDRIAKMLRILRWPVALIAICIALAVFVYFLMPDNIDRRVLAENTTVSSDFPTVSESKRHKVRKEGAKKEQQGTKTAEIDFYDNENDKTDIADSITETIPHRKLPVEPVFPSHITPEVQYGNERADTDKLRTPKVLDGLLYNSTERPHITHKPEKPLEVSIKEASEVSTEAINRAETINEFASYGEKQTTKKIDAAIKTYTPGYKDPNVGSKSFNENHYLLSEPRTPPEIQELHSRQSPNVDVNFTSGHSKFFGIGIEDAEKMKSTTQSSIYNTRVSPTLPTWRSIDETTTKKYPVNSNFEVPQCRSTRLTLCRGILPYDLAGSPATVGGLHVTSLLPQIEYLVATNCSDRVRHFACALMEPECKPPPFPTKKPCKSLCKAITDNCEDLIPRELTSLFDCSEYSQTNCVSAQAPCFPREHQCKDGTCIPRDWICDGSEDCLGGEDETICTTCDKNEFRCNGGSCIPQRWLCDGYADCPDGQDESEGCENRAGTHHAVAGELGEEPSGSAPAPAVRRLNRLPGPDRTGTRGEIDNSKELLITSDSNNGFKRNFTRRPSTSRLTPYTRKSIQTGHKEENQQNNEQSKRKPSIKTTTLAPQLNDSSEDVNAGDLGFFEELKKITPPEEDTTQRDDHKMYTKPVTRTRKPGAQTRLDKTINRLEKVIDGSALLKKAADEEHVDTVENNATSIEKFDDSPKAPPAGPGSSHTSPCPTGELRCVDGRCITLAQLCDGTIDCTDHADEDNCYT